MPHFTPSESLEIQGSADFLGFNHYSSGLVYPTPADQINPNKVSRDADSDVSGFKDPKWYKSSSDWLTVTPFGFRRNLNWLSKYGKPIIVTENGFSDYIGNLDDMQRVYYYKHYINQMLKGKIVSPLLVVLVRIILCPKSVPSLHSGFPDPGASLRRRDSYLLPVAAPLRPRSIQ